MNSGKVYLGILAGFAAGALLGLLFAPEKDSDCLLKIAENEADFSDNLDRKFDRFLEILNKKMNQATVDLSKIAKRE